MRRNPDIHLSERNQKLVLSTDALSLRSSDRGMTKQLVNRHEATRSTIEVLGEMRIDDAGRLIVFGGYGRSVYVQGLNPKVLRDHSLASYANNDGWFDDVADGPVTAVIHFKNGSEVTVAGADGAWFISAPPDFAPAVPPVRSLWDTLMDVFIRYKGTDLSDDPTFRGTHWSSLATAWKANPKALPGYRVSFKRDIQPILEAAARIPAVFDFAERPAAHQRFSSTYMARLGGKGSEDDARISVFARLRAPGTRVYDESQMPLSHGDYLPLEPATGVRKWLTRFAARWPILPRTLHTVSPLQYSLLSLWAAGDFDADWSPGPSVLAEDSQITGEGLDQASLKHGVGGSFFPGIEASWLLLDPHIFIKPFRLNHGYVVRSKGAVGPITIQPGFVTAQMALPWQADFASCKKTAGITTGTSVAWWPSQRPDDVYVEGPGKLSLTRRKWAPAIDALEDDNERHLKMVDTWAEHGFVIEEEGLGLYVRKDGLDEPNST
jgi:hypothetical protein